ncbi:MAG TPA: hypothetical protein EYP69_00260 [Bacteroidales bacterium]|nr:hypothetical protein [Bacteroidales bacterium]
MKKLKLLLILFFAINSWILSAQTTETYEENPSETSIMLGCISISDFQKPPFVFWYQPAYDSYPLDTCKLLKISSDTISGISVEVIFGSWCSDSRSEIPIFLKVCDYLNISENITLIGVDKSKTIPSNCDENKIRSVKFVPTYFFYYNGKLLKKIVDHSDITIEHLFSLLY